MFYINMSLSWMAVLGVGVTLQEDTYLHLKTIPGKLFLNLPWCTSNDAVRYELGLEASKGIIVTKIIKYYNYILEKKMMT